MGKKSQIRYKDKKARRLPVDASKLNMGNTYSSPPEYYYDISFTCRDCSSEEIWSAEQQKWWYEEAGGYFISGAIRCRSCRERERERQRAARRQAGRQDMRRRIKPGTLENKCPLLKARYFRHSLPHLYQDIILESSGTGTIAAKDYHESESAV